MTAATTDRRITGAESAPRTPREDQPPAVWPVWVLKLRERYDSEKAALQRRIDELESSMIETDAARRKADGQSKALALYGESAEVKDLTKRLTFILPNAEKIGPKGVALVAQIAIAHGLDPMPGSDHVYAWVKDSTLTVAIGYKGLLYLARQQAHFTHRTRAMLEEERREHKLNDDQLGYITELYEIDKAVECHRMGVPYFPIIGMAIWAYKVVHTKKNGETWTETNEPPSGKDGVWVCRKNSLKDALRQITDTGVRMKGALDAAFDQQVAEWRMTLPDAAEADPEELIAAGIIPPDDDGEPEIIDGSFAVTPALCANCGVEPAVSTPLGEDLCEVCAKRQADAEAATR
jgi:hypothetical protein